MSVRAYKLIEIKTAPNPTFNCWHEERIMDLAIQDNYGGENGGHLSFEVEEVQDALLEAKKEKPLDKDYIASLKQIIKDANKGDMFVEYYCY